MANPEHVEVVKQGALAINGWLATHPGEGLNLEGADLRRINLTRGDLTGANLIGADLEGADLFQTILIGADLQRANLVEADASIAVLATANLIGANLRRVSLASADLTLAKLQSADLRDAELKWASLSLADVTDADFEGTAFFQTILADIDLSRARGLEGVEHNGPSAIDERTLRKSWPLPEVFLRGVGLSEEMIDFARATYGKAIEFYSCFISYSTKDDDFAHRLHADLQAKGVRCWFAPEDLRIGDKFRARIDEAIRLHDKLLLILSEESVNSTWVEDEVESALEKERKSKQRGEERIVLFPIRLDSAVMETDAAWAASIRRTRHIGDFTEWKDHDAYQKSFERLLRDLKSGAKD